MMRLRTIEKAVFVLACLLCFAAHGLPLDATSEKTSLEEHELKIPQNGIASADFSPDGRYLALGLVTVSKTDRESKFSFSDALGVWDLKSRELVFKTEFDSGGWVTHCEPRFLQYMPDGHRVVLLANGALTVIDAASPKDVSRIDLGVLPNAKPWVVDMKVAPAGNRAAVLITYLPPDYHSSVRIYDLKTKRVVWEWSLSEDSNGYSLAFSPDGTKIAVAMPYPQRGTGLVVLDISSSREVLRLTRGQEDPTASAVFASNDQLLTVPVWDGRHMKRGFIKLWDLKSRRVTRQITASPGGVHKHVDLSKDGRYVLGYIGMEKAVEHFTEDIDERFRIWELTSGNVIATSSDLLRLNRSTLPDFRFSPDGQRVIAYWPATPGAAQLFELTPAIAAGGSSTERKHR